MNDPTPPPPSETAMTDRRICPTCCHFRDADVPCSDAFHIAPPSETKLSEALNEFATANQNYRDCELDPQKANGELESFQDEINAARSSLESLYREQILEIAEAREILLEGKPDCADDTLPSLLRLAVGSFRTRLAELSALRSLQLTPEEAKHLLTSGFQTNEIREASADFLDSMCKSAEGKLRRISSKATTEEL